MVDADADLTDSLQYGQIRPRPAGMTVLDLLEKGIREGRGETAVAHPAGTLTYRELGQRAISLAFELHRAGVQRGSLVPLLLEDPVAILVAMIATMKVAAAFVPFNMDWPTARHAALLAELGVSVAIGQAPTAIDCPVNFVAVSADVTSRAVSSDAMLPQDLPRPAAGDPVYGFFTSGSTGRPKCAINVHRGLVNRFLSMTELFADDGAVVLQNSAHTFDSSIWQLLWPLTRRGMVVIPDRNGILDYSGTLAEIERYGVTMTDFVPTLFDLLVERVAVKPENLRKLSSLRRILIGGETANPRTVQVFRDLLPDVHVTNTYGPTEASIGSVFHPVSDDDVDVIPLGRPLPNTCVLLLDEAGQPITRGSIGEIYIGGLCVGAGYHADPERTAAAFVPDPYLQVPGSTLYRTGDFGWFRDDGALMFSGRRDEQVKVAGTRIDLGEVESVFVGLSGVRQVKVMTDGTGAALSLVCFYSAQPPVTAAELRAQARAILPVGQVPSRFICLDALPLLSNGKVDREQLRRRLRRPESAAGPAAGLESRDLETAIARIWQRLLGFAVTSDDFFRAGGTSVIAARLAVDLEKAYQVPVSVQDIMDMPTVAAQARFIRSGQHPARSADGGVREDLDNCLSRFIRHAPRPRPRPAEPGGIVLLGATGFIGAQVLAVLLDLTGRPVVCLTRAGDDEEAGKRVRAALARIGRPREAPTLTVLAGDARASQLGLPGDAWHRLVSEAGAIIDAGGMVDGMRDYAAHYATNVEGTGSLLRLATEHVSKRFVMLSTTTVRAMPGTWLPEEFLPRHSPMPADGYSQSKWVAEQLVRAAAERGTVSTVVRLGDVAADSRTGRANPRSMLTMLLRLCCRLQARFATSARVDWTPVDSVARLVAACVLEDTPTFTGPNDELLNAVAPASVSVSGLMRRLRGPDGRRLLEISYQEFLDRASRAIGSDEVARGLAVLRPLRRDADPLAGVISDASAGTESLNAAKLAQRLRLAWRQPSEDELHAMITHITSTCLGDASESQPVLRSVPLADFRR